MREVIPYIYLILCKRSLLLSLNCYFIFDSAKVIIFLQMTKRFEHKVLFANLV